jgi:hypothetical protein
MPTSLAATRPPEPVAGRARRPVDPPGACAPPAPATHLALRIAPGPDADALGEQLPRLWRARAAPRRGARRIELSIVETCGRSREERERDALRLLQAEAAGAPWAGERDTLRATLVSVDTDEHLLLLAAGSGAVAAGAVAAVVSELARLYPVAMLAMA